MKKVFIVFFLGVSLVIFLSSCKKQKETLPLILAVLPTSDNPYWQDMRKGIEMGMITLDEKCDIRVFTGGADTDAQRQIDVMKSFLDEENVSALILGPASGELVVPTVARFIKSGIPVIVVDSMLDPEALKIHNIEVDLFIGSRNEQGGKLAAERIEYYIGSGERTVLLIEGSPVHETAIARQNGFINAAPEAWQIKEERADWDMAEANRVTRSFLQSKIPDGIFSASDEMAMGVIAALNASGISAENWPIVVGFDATEDGLFAIEAGNMCATIKQEPQEMGRRAVDAAWNLIRKMPGNTGKDFIDVKIIPQNPGDCRGKRKKI